MSDTLESGTVVSYPYLWRRQRDAGETEGRKERPVCVVISYRPANEKKTRLLLLAITSQPPQIGDTAVAIPALERKRAGLSTDREAWVIVGEFNYDIAEDSFYLDTQQAPLGRFTQKFLAEIQRQFRATLRNTASRIDRR